MQKIYKISLYIIVLLPLIFCSTKPVTNCQINSHNLQLFLNPEANSLTAIDSIGISYKEKTDHIYFLLHDSLDLEKIEVGHLAFEFSKVGAKEKESQTQIKIDDFKDASLYKVKIPFNLSPNSMRVYYSGYIWEPDQSADLDKFGKFLLTNKRVILKKDSCWYPTIPDNRSPFSVSTCSPVNLSLHCNAKHNYQQLDGDYIINRWIFAEPVDGVSILSTDG